MGKIIDTSIDQSNKASQFILHACNTDFNRTNACLQNDLRNTLGGNCVYLPHFIASDTDLSLFQALERELFKHEGKSEESIVKWSKHLKHENPQFSETFQNVVETLADYFDVDIFATRLNYYPDGTQWKPYHRDSHAYAKNHANDPKHKEDFTIGISFGAQRHLAFLHEQSQVKFLFPQNNGDCFAFSSEVNDKFLHGVPKAVDTTGKRFSIIAWGRRRSLNSRNSAAKSANTGLLKGIEYSNVMEDMMARIQRARISTPFGEDLVEAKPRKVPIEKSTKQKSKLGRLQ